jgi:hypothetical protein
VDPSHYERYEHGSPAAELPVFAALAREIMRAQERNRRRAGIRDVRRAFHPRALLGATDATLTVREDLPADLVQGPFRPGAVLPATVRLSAAAGVAQLDSAKDLYGLAVRLTGPDSVHDLLMTSWETSPAANAHEFVAMASAVAGRAGTVGKLFGLLTRLPRRVGLSATWRIVRNLVSSSRYVPSLATETYYSRGAILWGPAPVRYRTAPRLPEALAPLSGPTHLRDDLARRLARGDLRFELQVQRFVSEAQTPVEDTSRAWSGPWTTVGLLRVPARNLAGTESVLAEHRVERLAFNPWNTTEELRPLGHLNRARRAAYEASSAYRRGERFREDEPVRQVVALSVVGRVFGLLNERLRVPWHRLPTPLALLNLAVLRHRLRRENLRDPGAPTRVETRSPTPEPVDRNSRTLDGRCNDLAEPGMGAAASLFGRNMPATSDDGRDREPDPVTVAERVLRRERFIPATSLNVLAAAWIQFQVHDWVHHGRAAADPIRLPVPPELRWRNRPGEEPTDTMLLARDSDPDRNTTTHWWDASEIYGATPEAAAALRAEDGRLRLEAGHLPRDAAGLPETGFGESWWLGLSAMQTLFAREHNAVCEALAAEYPALSADRRYEVGRLVVSALIAKIHTVEWTPAILGTDAADAALNINWRGAQADLANRVGLSLLDPHAVHGIPGSTTAFDRVPFALTEEFVTVYRMHPLIPDDFVLGGSDYTFAQLQGAATETVHRELGLPTVLRDLARANPGAVVLHNFPEGLRRFERDGEYVDLAVVDVLRPRMRRVPRYTAFREALHLPPVADFVELCGGDRETAQTLHELYDGDLHRVDTVVGLLAERPPKGFGFSDTAFRMFLLMASRRLQSDRFLTVDYRAEVYTELGLDWVERGGMAEVVRRHCPELTAVPGGKAVFAPWTS